MRAPWQTSKPAPSKPGPSARPLLLLQPLATGQGRPGSGCGLLLGYRIAAMDDERESIQDLSSPEEEEEEGEVVGWRSRDRLQALIRLEHNYSFSM